MTRHKAARHGFTLIELLAATLVMVLGVCAMLSVMTQGLSSLKENQWALLARTAVVRKAELLRNQGFDAIIAGPFTAADLQGLESIPNAQGNVYVELYNDNPDIKKATVTVTAGAGRAWRLATLVSR